MSMFGSDFTRIDENDELHRHIKRRFFKDLEGFGLRTEVVSVHRNSRSTSFWQGKLKAFQSYVNTHEEIGNGNANLRQAWFSASKAQIVSILSRGCFSQAITNGGIYGPGVSLSPLTIDGVNSSVPDEYGVRYMVWCCVIMGQMEILHPVSKQNCSSSNKYHSGVDDLVYPTKYLIRDGYTDSHVFPVFVISFKSRNDVVPAANNTQKERPSKKERLANNTQKEKGGVLDLLDNLLQTETFESVFARYDSYCENRLQPETWEKILERFDLYLQAPPICNQSENGLPSRSTTPSSTRVANDDVQKSPADEPRGSPNDEKQQTVHDDKFIVTSGLADPGQEWLDRHLAFFNDWLRQQQ